MPDDIRMPESAGELAPVETAIEQQHQSPKSRAFEAGASVSALVPRTLGELAMVASAIIMGGLAPDSYIVKDGAREDYEKTKARIMIGIMKGAEVGMPPITALSTIAIINNRPTIWGDGAVALVQRAGVIERIEQLFEGAPEEVGAPAADDRGELNYAPKISDFGHTMTAVFRIWRKGMEVPYEGRFSVRDAMRAHLWGNTKKAPWIEYPKRMLMARARAYALRDGFADCLMGLSIREEIEDIPAPAPKTDASFLDDGPVIEQQQGLPAPDETPLPMQTVALKETVSVEQTQPGEPAERAGVAAPSTAAPARPSRDEKWWEGDRLFQFSGDRRNDVYMVRQRIAEARDTGELGSLRGHDNEGLIANLPAADREDIATLYRNRTAELKASSATTAADLEKASA